MLESYFFVPSNSEKFINKIDAINANHFILDIEDSVPQNERQLAISNCLKLNHKERFFVRPYLDNIYENENILITKLLESGFKKFVLPKSENLNIILENLKNVEVILLVEQASTLLYIEKIVLKYKDVISGLALGAQDFTSSMGIKYDRDILNIVRLNLLTICKTYDLDFIDTASMNINKDKSDFENECINAYNMGCDGKFIIHPLQLEVLNTSKYFSDEEINWAKNILNSVDLNQKSLGAVKIDGQVFEKPHLKKLLAINKYLEKNGIK